MYVYCVYSAMSYSSRKQLPHCLKRAETDVGLSVLDVRAYIVSFLSSLDMNQVPEKLYLGQNLKQHVMKEQRSAYKSYIEKIILNLLLNYPDQNISNQFKPKKLLYIKSLGTNKTGVISMRSDGHITADTK